MATQLPPDDEQAELAQGAPDDEASEEGGFTVCIHSDAQGTLTVGVEGGDMQPVGSVKEAMTAALQLLKGGQMDTPTATNDQFQAGFKGASI